MDRASAYSYNEESGTLPTGWIIRNLENTATTDLQNALAQGWFAIGFVDWDFSTSYYIEFPWMGRGNINHYLESCVFICCSC